MPIWIVAVNESRPNYVSYHFIFFLKIWLGGWNISFDKQSKASILFCYFFVILLTGSNDRFSEKIHKLEIYQHHFTWLLYLVICHFGKNCRTRLKISEMTIYIYQPIEVVLNHLYFWYLHSEKNLHDKTGLTLLHLATSLCKVETFVL